MTRKLPSILLFLAHLAVLPGCRNFLSQEMPPEGPPPANFIYPADEKQSKQGLSTAKLREEEKPPILRMPHEANSSHVGKKTPSEGSTGIVTAESSLDPVLARAIYLQGAPPLPVVEKKSEIEQAVMALQYMLEGRHPEAIKALAAYDADKQELLLRFMPVFVTLIKKRIDDLSNEEVGVLNKQLFSMIDELRPRSELTISKMCYCKDVFGFGSYNALPDHHPFLAGAQDRIGEKVQLYIELKNFASEPTKDGEFLTKLSCTLELHDSAEKKIWSKKVESKETTLVRRARLNDFHTRYGFYVPAVPAGTYRLTLHVMDETNPKRARPASKSIEFRVTPVANQPALR